VTSHGSIRVRAVLVVGATVAATLAGLAPMSRQARPQAASRAPAPMTLAEAPAGLQRAVETGASGPTGFVQTVSEGGRRGYEAAGSAWGFRASFSPAGVRFAADGGRTWSVSLESFGRPGAPERAARVRPRMEGGRLVYRRDALTEWYRSDDAGLEQGFTIARRPDGPDASPLLLRLRSGGDLVPRGRGSDVALMAGQGAPLTYGSLRAFDADGTELPASIRTGTGRITLRIDDRGAAYPLVVDPVVFGDRQQLVPSSANDQFGAAIAIDGDTAVVGTPDFQGLNDPPVYVYVRQNGVWGPPQVALTVDDGDASDDFGYAVDVSGDTVVVGARHEPVGSVADAGVAYVFVRTGTSWALQKKLRAADAGGGDEFGNAVAISGNTVVVGASLAGADGGPDQDRGAAYAFVRSGTTWTQQQKLRPSEVVAHDNLGEAVAVEGDTALVSAPGHGFGGATPGSTYVFVRSGATWTRQARLDSGDVGGDSVALSGSTAVIGAPFANNGAGDVHVFVRSGSTWSAQQTLFDPDFNATSDINFFGVSVSIEGDTIVVTNTALGGGFPDAPTKEGFFLFARTGTNWAYQGSPPPTLASGQYLAALDGNQMILSHRGHGLVWVYSVAPMVVADDGSAGDSFGISVGISGNTAVVGSWKDDTSSSVGGTNDQDGSAYVYVRSGGVWTQQAHLFGPGPATGGDQFGLSVAISGNTIVVGAHGHDAAGDQAGAAYAFVRQNGIWSLQQELVRTDPAAGDEFGVSVDVQGNTAIVGAWTDDTPEGADTGSAYLFVRSGSTWTQQGHVTAGDAPSGSQFGRSVAINKDTAIVGAPAYCDPGCADTQQGAAYVFVRSGGTWSKQQKLIAPGGTGGDQFGFSVDVDRDTAVIGAITDDTADGNNAGSARVFVRSGTTWTEQKELHAPDGAADDDFGQSVTIERNTVAVGAPFDDTTTGTDDGSAYVFTRYLGEWAFLDKHVSVDDGSTSHDLMGVAVALSGNHLITGNPDDDHKAPNGGNGYDFDVFARSIVTRFSTPAARTGTPIAIVGSGFTGATRVVYRKFDGKTVSSTSFSVASDERIDATIPSAAITGIVKVTTPAGSGEAGAVLGVRPKITSISPSSGPPGTVVTIDGKSFTGTTSVTFDGVKAASFTVVSNSRIKATVPGKATSGPITVTTAGGTARSTRFEVT
jgi:FG-GAP repeat/IPT/TIG domain